MLRIEQNLPARSQKRGEAPIPRVGKGLPRFGIERALSREGVRALDHQATPAAHLSSHQRCFANMDSLLFALNLAMAASENGP